MPLDGPPRLRSASRNCFGTATHEFELDSTTITSRLVLYRILPKYANASRALSAASPSSSPTPTSCTERPIPVDDFEQRHSRNRRTWPTMAFRRQDTHRKMHNVWDRPAANTRSRVDTAGDIHRLARTRRWQRGLPHSQGIQRPISAGSRVGRNGSVGSFRRRCTTANTVLWLHVG
jgi:hypothetical protein